MTPTHPPRVRRTQETTMRHMTYAPTAIDAEFVIYRLEEAGKSMLGMPGLAQNGSIRCGWPEVVHDFREAYGWMPVEMSPPRPQAAQISRMDEALSWLALIPPDRYVLRRIVGLRAMVSPRTDRHLYSWRRIGVVLGCSHEAVRGWHSQGVGLIVAKLRERENSP